MNQQSPPPLFSMHVKGLLIMQPSSTLIITLKLTTELLLYVELSYFEDILTPETPFSMIPQTPILTTPLTLFQSLPQARYPTFDSSFLVAHVICTQHQSINSISLYSNYTSQGPNDDLATSCNTYTKYRKMKK